MSYICKVCNYYRLIFKCIASKPGIVSIDGFPPAFEPVYLSRERCQAAPNQLTAAQPAVKLSRMKGSKPMSAAHRRNRSEPISPTHRATIASWHRPPGLLPPLGLDLQLPPVFSTRPVLADWTSRSTRLLGCVLGLLLLLAVAAVPRSPELPQAQTAMLREPVLLHQTVPSFNLSRDEVDWRTSWERLGFQLQIADDARCREHIRELVRVTGDPVYLQAWGAISPRAACELHTTTFP